MKARKENTNLVTTQEDKDMTLNEMIKAQKFGVEVEMTNISRLHAQSVVERVLSQYGRVRTGHRYSYDNHFVIDHKGREWKCESDSSIKVIGEGSCEFVTPPLNYEDIELLQEIIRALRAEGAKSDSSCGIHVHVDGANHNAVSLMTLYEFFIKRQDLFYDAIGISQPRRNRWCKKSNIKVYRECLKSGCVQLSDIRRCWYSEANDGYCEGERPDQHYNMTRYHGLNLHAFFSKGTVEFRLFNSTMHAGKIKAYVQFCLAMSAWAITNSGSRTMYKNIDHYTPQQRLTIMENLMVNRLGLKGKEFKTCRLHMLANLRKMASEEAVA